MNKVDFLQEFKMYEYIFSRIAKTSIPLYSTQMNLSTLK